MVNKAIDAGSQDYDNATINCSEKGTTYEFTIKLRKKSG